MIYEIVTNSVGEEFVKYTPANGSYGFIPKDEENKDYQAYLATLSITADEAKLLIG